MVQEVSAETLQVGAPCSRPETASTWRTSRHCERICLSWNGRTRSSSAAASHRGRRLVLAPLRATRRCLCGTAAGASSPVCAAAGAVMPTTRCGRSAAGRESDPDSAIARQLAYWSTALTGLPDGIELRTDRPRPPAVSHRRDSVPLRFHLLCMVPCWSWPREQGEACSGAAGRSCSAAHPLGAGTDIAMQPIAGRTDSALDDSSASSSIRWCCAPTPQASRASAT